MALLLKNDAVFLHVPKTGGMWVTAVLRELGLVRCHVAFKHADMERVLSCWRYSPGRYLEAVAKAGPGWQRRVRRGFKFCFVRHPISWYESWWAYMSSLGWRRWGVDRRGRRRWHPNADLDGFGDADFNRFVANVLDAHPGYVTRLYGRYATAHIDFVGRQEGLAADLLAILRKFDTHVDASFVQQRPRVNESASARARPHWDEGLRRRVIEAERKAIEQFGYDC